MIQVLHLYKIITTKADNNPAEISKFALLAALYRAHLAKAMPERKIKASLRNGKGSQNRTILPELMPIWQPQLPSPKA
ncbi:hypothetical protein [Paenibacillus sp. GCM10027626]|uniref:hypothetical protein n=1 Tax=Paenibacillus sp. GCM10027626 TaxID=3273411 RepID=UPI0036328260